MYNVLPKITVVTPSYNQGQYIEKTILSVINQNYSNIEYILIDGGSADNSVEIIKKYADKLSYWVSEKDKGQADALNKGFERATGDVLCWINSDDTFEGNTFERVAFWYNKISKPFILTGYSRFIKAGKTVWEPPQVKDPTLKLLDFKAQALLRCWENSLAQPSTFWSREVYLKIGNIAPDYFFAMDLEYWLRAIKSEIPIYSVPEVYSNFLYHETSKTINSEERLWKDLEALADKFVEDQKERQLFLKDLNIYKKSFFLIKKSNTLASSDRIRSIKFLFQGVFNHFPSFIKQFGLIRNTILKLLYIKR